MLKRGVGPRPLPCTPARGSPHKGRWRGKWGAPGGATASGACAEKRSAPPNLLPEGTEGGVVAGKVPHPPPEMSASEEGGMEAGGHPPAEGQDGAVAPMAAPMGARAACRRGSPLL